MTPTTFPWREFLEGLGGVSVLVAALTWLIRTLLAHLLSKDLEEFKAGLGAETTLAVERLKTQLNTVAKEHEIRFGTLQQKRADLIADLYSQLETAYLSAIVLRVSIESRDIDETRIKNCARAVWDRVAALYDPIGRINLFLPQEQAQQVVGLYSSLLSELPDLGARRDIADEEFTARCDKWLAYWQEHEKEIRSLQQSLQREFRVLLGSEPQAPPPLS